MTVCVCVCVCVCVLYMCRLPQMLHLSWSYPDTQPSATPVFLPRGPVQIWPEYLLTMLALSKILALCSWSMPFKCALLKVNLERATTEEILNAFFSLLLSNPWCYYEELNFSSRSTVQQKLQTTLDAVCTAYPKMKQKDSWSAHQCLW